MFSLIFFLASIIAVLFVFVPHEYAHAFAAYKSGDATAKMYGRLTLNPIKHIDPVGIIFLIFTGFGWAKPVPINPYNFRNYRKGLFATAVAGVITNYIIAFIAYPLYLLLKQYALGAVEYGTALYDFIYFIDTVFYCIYLYSLSVFIFNLLPLYPLDGFRVVESLTREINPVRRFLRYYGYYILIFLVVESYLCDILVSYSIFPFAQYLNILGYFQWFARNIIGFPISALWDIILGVPFTWPI